MHLAPFSSIAWRFDRTNAEIVSNLACYDPRDQGGMALLAGNLENASFSLFVDGAGGDQHLASDAKVAIDQGVALPGGVCEQDMDGAPRPMGTARDIGADEYRDST